MAVTLEDIQIAADLIRQAVVRTPTCLSRSLSAIAHTNLFLKLENFQITGSFKERGALVKLKHLTANEAAAGVIAMSAGNHAQGVAYHAQRLGIPATIVMPQGTPYIKVQRTASFGARVMLQGDGLEAASAFAHELAIEEGLTFVHPYDDYHVIQGQGTIALEMLADCPDLEMLVIPIGGGGLISGMAIAAKALKPSIQIIGVQTELCPSMYQLRYGQTPTLTGQTIAEGIAVKHPGKLTRAIIDQYVDDIVLVSEPSLESAVQLIAAEGHLVAEGAGAAPLAAVLSYPERFADKQVGLVVCGGNIDARILSSILMRGLMRSQRIVYLRVEMPDIPGMLATVAGIVGAAGANIIEVQHQRLFTDISIKQTHLDLVIEVRDPEQVHKIVQQIQTHGFPARVLDAIGSK
ncbi:MAG: threonine ammonia-lyase [Oculatellaceae cyanobacterium bins.114]|nr:threonine ammonia-lyase [Oculatellaceae cyanobacterium bins.114]